MPLDSRLESFITRFGELPRDARRLEDFEAREHPNPWIRRMVGRGIACNYVLCYVLGAQSWTFCFDRIQEAGSPQTPERWWVEIYHSDGASSSGTFEYLAHAKVWRAASALARGPGRPNTSHV